jgi:putative ABC transport system permease protein
MDTLIQDLRYTIRVFGKSPVLSTLVVLTLALGIGASTAIFTVVNGVLLRPLPFDEPSRLVYLGTTWGVQDQPVTSSIPDFLDWKARIATLEEISASQSTSLTITDDGLPERVQAAQVSPGLFRVLRTNPAFGRSFLTEEHGTGAGRVVILSHGLWMRRWGGDPEVIGKTFTASARESGSYRVIGVMPAEFRGPAVLDLHETEVFLPLAVDGAAHAGDRSSRSLRVAGRLKPGISLEEARQEIDVLSAAMVAEFPDVNKWRDVTLGIGIVSLRDRTVGPAERELLILLVASGFLLLIACANVANLFLARSVERGREFGLRSALGAGRGRIVRQLVTESVFLAILGGVAGVWLALLGLDAFAALGPSDFPRLAEVGLDLHALAFVVVVSMITGIFSGLAPAIINSRASVSEALKDGGGATGPGRDRVRLRKMFVVAETASALVLLIAAGLLIKSFVKLNGVDPGFNPDNVLLMQVGLEPAYDSDEQRAAFIRDLVQRIEAIPGTRSVSSITDPPIGYVMWSAGVRLEGGNPDEARICDTHLVSPDYFRTMGITLLQGRPFKWKDDADHPRVAIVGRTMARELWPGEDPLGRRIKLSGSPEAPWWTVVGVVNDIRQASLDSALEREFYIPYAQNAWFGEMHILVRTESAAGAMAGRMRQALWDLDPAIPFDGVSSMRDRISSSLNAPRFRTLLLFTFAGVALVLAVGGLYGTLLHTVNQRTREVGIRMALGARPVDVLTGVLREGMTLTGIGLVIGLAVAFAVSRLLTSLLYDLAPTDPVTFLMGALALAAAALLACSWPARKATQIDPVQAMRSE